jgi:TonB family protein
VAQAASAAFISYSREDSEFALRLAGDLKAAGANVWLDQLDIVPGQRWDRAVEDALSHCPRMLVVLSPVSVKSTNVMDEVSFALEERKTVIPIMFQDCPVPFRLRRVQYVDFRQDYSRGLKELVKTLDPEPTVSELCHPPQPDAEKAAEPKLTSKHGGRKTSQTPLQGAGQVGADLSRRQASEPSESDQPKIPGREVRSPSSEIQRVVAPEQVPPAAQPAAEISRNQAFKIFQFEEPKTSREDQTGVAADPEPESEQEGAESPGLLGLGFLSNLPTRPIALVAACGIAIVVLVVYWALTSRPPTPSTTEPSSMSTPQSPAKSTASREKTPGPPVDVSTPQSAGILKAPLDYTAKCDTVDAIIRLNGVHNLPFGPQQMLLANNVDPIYPPIAKAARVSGTVVLGAVISKTGFVEYLCVVSGPAMLQQAALDAVRSWRYMPYLRNGEPVEVSFQINVVFSLGN